MDGSETPTVDHHRQNGICIPAMRGIETKSTMPPVPQLPLTSLTSQPNFSLDKNLEDSAPTLFDTEKEWCSSFINTFNANGQSGVRGRNKTRQKVQKLPPPRSATKKQEEGSSNTWYAQMAKQFNDARANDGPDNPRPSSQPTYSRPRKTSRPSNQIKGSVPGSGLSKNDRKQPRKKWQNKPLLSPRFVKDLLNMANEEGDSDHIARGGHRTLHQHEDRILLAARRKKMNPFDLPPKVTFYVPDSKLMQQPARHIEPLQRESLYGATPDCYLAQTHKRTSNSFNASIKGLIAPDKSPMIYKKSASQISFGGPTYKKETARYASKYERAKAPPHYTKWLEEIKRIDMELRGQFLTEPNTQHFCCNLDMPLNPFLQADYQEQLRRERARLLQEKEMLDRFEYEERKKEAEDYKMRINILPRMQRLKREREEKERRERERKRQEEQKARERARLERMERAKSTGDLDREGQPAPSFFKKKKKNKRLQKAASMGDVHN